jgi:hypothetical protein
VEHAGNLHVHAVHGAAGYLGAGVDPRNRPADMSGHRVLLSTSLSIAFRIL